MTVHDVAVATMTFVGGVVAILLGVAAVEAWREGHRPAWWVWWRERRR